MRHRWVKKHACQEKSAPPSPRQARCRHGRLLRSDRRALGLDRTTSARTQKPAFSRWRATPHPGSNLCRGDLFRAQNRWSMECSQRDRPLREFHGARPLPGVGGGRLFLRFWQADPAEYDAFNGIDWAWRSTDGAMTRAPLAGEKTWAPPRGPQQNRHQTLVVRGGWRRAGRALGGWSQPQRLQAARRNSPKLRPPKACADQDQAPAHAPGQGL